MTSENSLISARRDKPMIHPLPHQDKGAEAGGSAPIDIEPAGEHMSSRVTPLIVESGRVYAFYCYDHDWGTIWISNMRGHSLPVTTRRSRAAS
jgi:hypothetical protein